MIMSMRRAISDAMLTAGGALAVVIGLVVINDRVRHEIVMQLTVARPSGELASVGGRARDLAMVMLQAAHDQSLAHAPLVIFAFAGIVLFVFMLRT
jgi:hypothetical protein